MLRKKINYYLLIRVVTLLTLILGVLPPASSVAQSGTETDIITSAVCPLTNIVAVTYVESTGEIVVIGTDIPGETPIDQTYLLDNVTVAIRILYHPHAGVSLESIGDPHQQQMQYTPENIRDIHFGNMLAEADIVLKVLGLGVDNETNQPINSNVSGYKSIPQRLEDKGWDPSNPNVIWRIFISLKPQIRVTTDGHDDIGFEPDHVVEVEWDFLDGSANDPIVTEAVQEFIDHINQNYEAFAAEFNTKGNPSLQETVELGKLMALVRWLQDYVIPIQTSGGAYHQTPFESSPDLVPIIEVIVSTSSLLSPDALRPMDSYRPTIGPFYSYAKPQLSATDDISLAAIALVGGVDFSGQNVYQDDDGSFEQIVNDVMALRVGDEPTWSTGDCGGALSAGSDGNLETSDVSASDVTYTAIAFPISGSFANIFMPIVLKNSTPPPPGACLPPGTLANWKVDNQTGGNLLAELIGDGSHVFPVGETCWSGIQPATYDYRITSQGGPCQGAVINGTITFSPGGTEANVYTCN